MYAAYAQAQPCSMTVCTACAALAEVDTLLPALHLFLQVSAARHRSAYGLLFRAV
jgi:hypothetical protein